MITDIRSLQLLERDLEGVAERERDRLDSLERALNDGGPGGPRRLPRRGRGGGGGGHSWAGVAAAVVAVLVLAGGIGFLSQGGSSDDSGGSGGGARRAVGDGAESATTAPALGPGVEGFDGGTSYATARSDELQQALQPGAAPGSVDTSSGRQGVGAAPAEQGDLTKIIRDGRIGIVIADGSFSRGVSRVTQIARANGGFVLASSSRDERSGSLTLRVPAKRFDDAMLALRGMAGDLEGDVEFQEITGQDVTAEFIDLGARLDILKERRDLLGDLQADATTSSEILRLASLIEDTQLQIENLQGRLNFLRDQVAEATIKVEVRERDVAPEESGPGRENPSLTDSFELAVQGFLRIVGAVVVGLGYLIPLGVIALVGYGVLRLVRRRDRVAS
ncbi:MAG: DUF4349 domain-containing protein [Actinomycetota bacterium]